MHRRLFLLLVSSVLLAVPSYARLWTDNTGRFETDAQLVGVGQSSVELKLDNGEVVEVALRRLSPADQQYALERRGSAGFKGGVEKPSAGGAASLISLASFMQAGGNQPVGSDATIAFKSIYAGCRTTFHLVGVSGTVVYWAPHNAPGDCRRYLARLEQATGGNPSQFMYYRNINGDPSISTWAIARRANFCGQHAVWYADRSGWHKWDSDWRELPR